MNDVSTCCEAIPYGVCDNRQRLQFTPMGLLNNNLGGRGPGAGPRNIRIDDAFPASRNHRVEMRISVPEPGQYTLKKVAPDNKLVGGFLQVEVMAGTKLNLRLQLHDSLNGESVLKSFFLTVAGINMAAGGSIVESVTADGYAFYNLSSTTTLLAEDVGGHLTRFSAGAYGSDNDQPGAMHLTNGHIDRAVSFKYTDTDTARLTLSVTGSGQGYRSFLIGGTSNLGCPSVLPLCNTMMCPNGQKLKPDADSMFCAGPACGMTADADTCCEEISFKSCDSNSLVFKSENLALSNLGGLGPDSGGAKLMYANVIPSAGRAIDLEVRNVTEYTPGRPDLNGVRGGFGFISITANTSTVFEFRLVDLKGEFDGATGTMVGAAMVAVPEALDAKLSG